ncbi:MAG: prepilin peptidase [bacterium]|nr:prepilin peptidase [bacterium]
MRPLPIAIGDSSRAAALLGTSLLVTGGSLAAPLATGTSAFLLLITEQDLRELRISNRLTGPGLVLALAYSSWVTGVDGALSALGGAAVGLGILFPFFALRWLGAGDVKAVMVLGAVLGASAMPGLLTWTAFAGGLVSGLAWLVDRASSSVSSGTASRAPGLPFALAIVLGFAANQQWGNPWTL